MSDHRPPPRGAPPSSAPPPVRRPGEADAPGVGAFAGDPTGTVAPGHEVRLAEAPPEWSAAEQHAPGRGPSRSRPGRGGRVRAIPVHRESTFVANAAATAAGFISATAWYLADVLGAYEGPWTPLAVALVIAASIRLSSRAHPTHRSAVSAITYLLVLLIVVILLTHRDLVAIYGEIDDYRTYEESLLRSRLQHPLHLVAYGVGGLVAAVVPLLGDRR